MKECEHHLPPPRKKDVDHLGDKRWTPNGTMVPPGPPPGVDQGAVESLKWLDYSGYESKEVERQLKWLGPEPPRILSESKVLSDPVCRGGMESRQAQVDGGTRSRHAQDEEAERMSLQQALWSDAEEQRARLEKLLEERYRNRGRFEEPYWTTPMSRDEVEGVDDGRSHQVEGREVRAGAARPLSRAHDLHGRDRAVASGLGHS